jgi:ATP-dependent Clp protease, protease subunit
MEKRKRANGKRVAVPRSERFDSHRLWLEHGIDFEKRRIMIDAEIDEGSVGWAVRGLMKMVDFDAESGIDIFVNSFGGSVYDGLAFYDIIKSCPAPITTYSLGKVMSMATIIFLAGDERITHCSSTFMLHAVSSMVDGKLFEMELDVKETKRLNEILLQIIVDSTKHNASWWTKQLKYEDKYFDAEAAVEAGIASSILGREEEGEE